MLKSKALASTILYALSVALMRGISIIMLPFMAHFLSPEDFGRMEILASLAIFGSVIVGFGLEDALYRFAAQYSGEKRKKVAAGLFFQTLVIGISFLLFSVPLSTLLTQYLPGNNSTYAVDLVLFMLALEGVIAVPLGWLRMNDRALSFCLLTISRAVMHACLTLTFLYFGRGVEGVFEAALIAAILQAIGLTYLQIQHTGIHIDFSLCKKTLKYCVPIVGSGLLAFTMSGLDRWVIAENISVNAVAIYGIAAKFSIALAMLMQPFGMWWMPRRFEELNQKNGHIAVLKYSVFGLILLITLTLCVGITAPWLISWLMPHHYHNASIYLLGLLIVVALKEGAEIINIGCFKDDNTNTQFFINLIASIIACVSLFLGAYYLALWGIVIALISAQTTRLLLLFYYSQKSLFLDYPIFKILQLFLVASVIVLLNYGIHISLFSGEIIALAVMSSFLIVSYFVFLAYTILKSVGYTIPSKLQISIKKSSIKKGCAS